MKKFNKLTVREIRRETPEAVSIQFDTPRDLATDYDYIQGQHLTLKREIGGEELRRCYSICTATFEKSLRIAVKEIADGRFSGFCNRELKAGDTLDVFPPMGNFYTELNEAAEKHYVAFVGGSGITPVISLIKTSLAVEPGSRFTLFYGNRNASSIIFLEELADLKNRFLGRLSIYHVLEDNAEEIDLLTGLLNKEKVDMILDHVIDFKTVDEFFICGPGPMMDAAEESLLGHAVDKKHIHIERFISGPGTAVKPQARNRKKAAAAEDSIADVTVIIDGQQTSFSFSKSQPSVLDAAIAVGANVPFACKGGVCATCRAKVIEGEVDMALNYGLEEDEVAAGYILTCQSTPKSAKLVVSYDE